MEQLKVEINRKHPHQSQSGDSVSEQRGISPFNKGYCKKMRKQSEHLYSKKCKHV